MDLKMKQRLVGLLVVLALLAIFMPMISYKMEPKHALTLTTNIPSPPDLPKVRMLAHADKGTEGWSLAAETFFEPPAAQNPVFADGVVATASVMIASANEMPSKMDAMAQMEVPAKLESSTKMEKQPKIAQNASYSAPSSQRHGSWIIQLGSFSSGKNIRVLLAKLSEKRIPTYKEVAFSKQGGKMVRIFVGPLLTENQAAEMKKELQQQLHISGIVKKKTA